MSLDIFEYPLLAVYGVALVLLFAYGTNCYVLIYYHHRGRRRAAPVPSLGPDDPHPHVTVQLPLYNEQYVARRVIEAAGRLRYPKDRLQIQVLDDSTDETSGIVAEAVAELQRRGLDVEHLRRSDRAGFKAGALAAGLLRAKGEFVAIFDADFVPPEDFLERTIAGFREPRVAVVQTRWDHLNRDYSLLTRAQAIGIDGHFSVEQGARCWGGLLLNFNGTAGIWRKTAITDAGGWTHDTLTEDLDLSYRAQLRGWRILFLPDVACPAELPVQVAGFKAQQRRWATGTIQTAKKLIPELLRASLPAWVKLQAILHLTHYLVHPLMLSVVLLSVPLLYLGGTARNPGALFILVTLVAVSTCGPSSLYVYGQRQLGRGWARRLRGMPFMMVIGVGIAVSNSVAILRALVARSTQFVRTPKFGISGRSGTWRGKAYRLRGAWEAIGELSLGLYALVGTWLFLHTTRWMILPFLVLYTLGFLWVGGLTMLEAALAIRGGTAPGTPDSHA